MTSGPEILEERDDGLRILRVRSPDEAAPYRNSFAGAYQDVFGSPPYNERFYASEAMGLFDSYLRTPGNVTLLAVKGATRVVAFGIGVPATSRPDIVRELRGLIPLRSAFYLAELGVQEAWRGRGLGHRLIELRLEIVDAHRFSLALLRTSATRNAGYRMYLELGFEDMGVYMEVPGRRLDGTVQTDRRLFLSRVLAGSRGA